MDENIIVRLRMKAEEFQRELDDAFDGVPAKAERAGEETGSGFARGFKAKHAAIGAAIGSAVVLAQQAISRSTEFARTLDETSTALNVTAEALQGFRHVAAQSGVGMAQMDGHLAGLQQRIAQAAAGGREAQQVFVDLGVGFQTTDGLVRATDAVFADLVQRISEIEDPAERARMRVELLGNDAARMAPQLAEGAAGLRAATAELQAMGAALSQDEIANLQNTNVKLEQLKTILSVSVSRIVADNTNSINAMADGLGFLAIKAADANARMEEFFTNRRQFQVVLNPLGAIAGAVGDFRARNAGDFNEFTPAMQADLQAFLDRGRVQAPRFSPVTQRAAGGRAGARAAGRSTRAAGSSAEDREREAAIRAAQRAEEDFERAIQRTLQAQEDSRRVEETRAELGDAAAAAEEARLSFQRQHPMAVHQTVDALTAALGITRQLTDAERAHYENLIASADAAENSAAANARRAVETREAQQAERETLRKRDAAQRDLQRQIEEERRLREAALMDVADLYEDLFTGNTDRIWKNFKAQGLRIVAEIAAQWTLALLSGQRGPLPVGGAAGMGGLAGPLGMLLGAGGTASMTRAAANDNLVTGGGLAGLKAAIGSVKSGGTSAGGAAGFGGLGPIGLSLAAGGISSALIGGGTAGQMGGLLGSAGGMALGGKLAALGSFGGPVGAIAGALLGTVLGGLFGGTKKASATIGGGAGGLSVLGVSGSSSLRGAASGAAGGVLDNLAQIAELLGGTLNSGAGRVSIGMRKNDFVVDPTGRGNTKGSGTINFGGDQQAAIEFAIRDLIRDGVIGGISAASQRILASGQDLEAAIGKAVAIESIPRLLRQRLDPLGAALDEVDRKFADLAATLREGGGSAEQIAQARQLWQLEREDTIRQIGAASEGLKQFLASLNAGPNSPLSLRQQQAEAEAALQPYVAAIEDARAAQAEVDRLRASGASASAIAAAEDAARGAAAGIDQQGFQTAAQLVLSISREMNASSGGFFADFDRIRGLTGGGIAAIDAASASPGAGRDPFTELTARNTGDMAAMLADTNRLLHAMNDNLSAAGGINNWGAYLQQDRLYLA